MSKAKEKSTFRILLGQFLRNPAGLAGLVIIFIMIVGALFSHQLTGYDQAAFDPIASFKSPNLAHWMGTDQLGADIFSRVLYGGRASIYIGVLSSLLGNLIGTILGAFAGYLGGKLDAILMRISELVMTFPQLILVLICVSLLGQGVNNVILIFAMTGWMTTFRLVRGEFFSLREEAFVEADRAFGFSKPRIIFRHMLPNTLSPIVVAFTINTAIYIIAEAGLSFLGLGVPITTPTWGNLLAAAQSPVVVQQYWWLWVFPALAIMIFVFGVNFIGDALRDVLDPRQRTASVGKTLRSKLFFARGAKE